MIDRLRSLRVWTSTLALAALLMFAAAPRAFAQDQGGDQGPDQGGADQDPPSRVARLSYITGSVSIQPAGADDWGTAELNRPVTTGDKLWADQGSRAELRLGGAAMRLSESTAFTFLNLTDTAAQVSVSEGTLNVHLRSLDQGQSFEIDTPNLAFTVLRPGDYSVSVDENGDTTGITVRNGDGEVTGGGQAFNLNANQTGTFTGTDSLSGDVEDAYQPDDFENWAVQRNAAFDRPPQYVSQEMVGYEDLETNGRWSDDPQYGHLWHPTVQENWAPYRDGHWAWIAPWGWTWVDDASWGFAPFHYGRWVTVRGAWYWTPGPVEVGVRPVYAPALVAWVGTPGVGLSIGVGGGAAVGVAWFPLGPREVYVPSYHVSEAYVTRVNVTNTVVSRTVINNVYINRTTVNNVTYVNRSAVTVTSRAAFTSAQPVSANIVHVDAAVIARAPVGTREGAGVAPERASLVVRGGGAGVHAPPAALERRAIVAKTAPPRAPVPFAEQQKAIAANGGRPLERAKLNEVRASAPAPRVAAAPVRVAPAARPQPISALKKPATPLARPGQPAGARPAANGARPGEAPAARPGEAPAARPGERPENRPAENRPAANRPEENRPATAARPGEAPNANRPGENRPAERPNENRPAAGNAPGNRPAENANRPPASSRPGENPAERPAEKPATNNANRPPAANRPEEKPAERPAAKPESKPEARPEAKSEAKPAPKNETPQEKAEREKRERENKPQ